VCLSRIRLITRPRSKLPIAIPYEDRIVASRLWIRTRHIIESHLRNYISALTVENVALALKDARESPRLPAVVARLNKRKAIVIAETLGIPLPVMRPFLCLYSSLYSKAT
jgi:hypothetical protein